MKRRLAHLWFAGWLVLFAVHGQAKEAVPVGADPKVEARVAQLGELLRCLVCQNQTIADSNAGLAQDLRRQIREQIALGRSDREIADYMVARYGDFVLYRPPVKGTTLLLWGGPFVLLLVGVGVVFLHLRRRAATGDGEMLTEEERRKATALLGGDAGTARQ